MGSSRKPLPGQLVLRGRGFPRPPRRRAWRVSASWMEEPGVVAAGGRSAARWRLIAAIRDAGYEASVLDRYGVTRAPEFDAWALADRTSSVVSEDFARQNSPA